MRRHFRPIFVPTAKNPARTREAKKAAEVVAIEKPARKAV
jgi:hypothetical protein